MVFRVTAYYCRGFHATAHLYGGLTDLRKPAISQCSFLLCATPTKLFWLGSRGIESHPLTARRLRFCQNVARQSRLKSVEMLW